MTKRNRLQLESTAEEDETPPSSPGKASIVLSTSPPHESKVRIIGEKVRVLSWEEKDKVPQLDDSLDSNEARDEDAHGQDVSTLDDPKQLQLQHSGSDSDDQDKKLKRKLADRSVSGGLSTIASYEHTKRVRDDAEEDDNPREKKRPSPPPEEERISPNSQSSAPTAQQDLTPNKTTKPVS